MTHHSLHHTQSSDSSQNPKDADIIYRTMREEDLIQGKSLSDKAGWNQLAADWQLLYRLNPQGSFVALHGDRVIGTVTTAHYEFKVGWVAMVLVDVEFRGRGIATKLMLHSLDALSAVESIQLDATPAGSHVYSKIGFHGLGSLKRFVSQGIQFPEFTPKDGLIRPMSTDDMPKVIAFDAEQTGVNRAVLLKGLLDIAPEYAWVWEVKQEIAGFVMGRHGATFEYIGPLMARDFSGAQALFSIVSNTIGQRPFAIDCLDSAAEWQNFLLNQGINIERPFTRMAYGKPTQFPQNTAYVYSIAGPDLG